MGGFFYVSGKEIAGKVTLKHIYEIALVKQQDPCWDTVPLERICKAIIGSAHSCGIQVVRDLDPEEYKEFLDERKKVVESKEAELFEARQAKLMRLT